MFAPAYRSARVAYFGMKIQLWTLLLQTCVAVKAFDVALEALQRAQEIGLQFFRADAYYSVMKSAVVNKRLDLAIQ